MHEQKRGNKSLINKNRNFLRRCASAVSLLLLFLAAGAFAQVKIEPPKSPAPRPYPTPPVNIQKPPAYPRKKRAENFDPTPAEKFIKTEAKVNISLCVAEGNVRINGWDRSEIRAFVSNGSKVGFKVLDKNSETQKPIWVQVIGYDPKTDKEFGLEECLAGENIEIDVPRAAIIELKSRESGIRIESVSKASVENVSGDILLDNIAGGIDAKTFEGDVVVENSGGSMSLFSTNGNIVAANVQASEIADSFKAKTRSGAVTLQSIGQRVLEVSSASGTIRFSGKLATSGRYNFNTTNGSILLALPGETSCKFSATYGFGAFQSDLPMKDVVKIPAGQVQKLTGTIGAGDCTLNLTTFSGAVRIRKQ